jgi:hypothetical protein
VAVLCVEVGVPEVSSITDSGAADTKTARRVLFSRGSASVKASVKPHTASEPAPLSCALVTVAVAAVASLSDCAT